MLRTNLVRTPKIMPLESAFFALPQPLIARNRPLLSRSRHFRALACNLLSCEAGKLGRLSAPSDTLFPGQRPTAP